MLRVRRVGAGDDRLRKVDAHRVLTAGLARAQHVEAEAGDDGGQPAAEVVDVARIGSAEPQPGILDGVVGLGHRAEHSVGHRPQVGSVGLEALGQPIGVTHRSRPSVTFRQSVDERNPATT